MNLSILRRCFVYVALLLLVISATTVSSHEATGGQLASANNYVNGAFSSVYYAEQSGGDVSGLVTNLNTAISLIQKAAAENATDPGAATADLANATFIAQMISLNSTSVSNSGSAARQFRLYGSIGAIAVTTGAAGVFYLKGDRIYRRLWLYIYRNHLVKKNDE